MTSYGTITESQTKFYLWTVPGFIDLLENENLNEMSRNLNSSASYSTYHTSSVHNTSMTSSKSTSPQLQVKMRFLGQDHDIIEIYFWSPISVFLKLMLTILCLSVQEHSIVLREYHKVQGGKWQYLATFYKRDILSIVGLDTSLRSSVSITLKLMITKDIKVDGSNVPETHEFEYLLKNGIFSDVTMKSVEGNEYKVHRAVLASRSVVLKAHFEHNTIECQTNIVTSPLEAEVLVEVLNFIYRDKAPRIDEIPERLLAAAKYYQLSRLKSLCEEALHKRLTVENAIETLQLADLHSAKLLKRLTLEFIKNSQAKLITRTEGWANLKSVELIKTIFEYITADDKNI